MCKVGDLDKLLLKKVDSASALHIRFLSFCLILNLRACFKLIFLPLLVPRVFSTKLRGCLFWISLTCRLSVVVFLNRLTTRLSLLSFREIGVLIVVDSYGVGVLLSNLALPIVSTLWLVLSFELTLSELGEVYCIEYYKYIADRNFLMSHKIGE